MKYRTLREGIISKARSIRTSGLGVGTAGNISARTKQGFLITPTGVQYENLKVQEIVELTLSGEIVNSVLKPSSEWHFHRDIYVQYKQAGSIVHVHSPYATAIAGGDSIRCAKYATAGTENLSKNAVKALKYRKACLLANHGMITLGESIDAAFRMAEEVEELAKQYYLATRMGPPVLLDKAEMSVNLEMFKNYGKQHDQ
jgi:L-fuculose-phosphate aldolase